MQDIPGKHSIGVGIALLAEKTREKLAAGFATSLFHPFDDKPLYLNGTRLRGLGSMASDGWSVTLKDPHMSSVTVYAFNGYRMYSANLGYGKQSNKTSRETFRVVFEIVKRAKQPLSVYLLVRLLALTCPANNQNLTHHHVYVCPAANS